MGKVKKSKPAIFMYLVIAITVIISLICFDLYYLNIYKSEIILWTGITAFTIMYHLWVRIIMGNVCKLFKSHIKYDAWWFKETKFENKLYKLLRVKSWKGKALTYNPELFSLKDYSLEEIANTMSKVEVDHWINEIISLTTILFATFWGNVWIFILTSIIAMVFDGQFIIIQRYNRPRIVKIIEKKKLKMSKGGIYDRG